MDYKTSGVDIEAGYRSVELMKKYVKETMRPEVLGGLGGFSGAFSLKKFMTMENPTDGRAGSALRNRRLWNQGKACNGDGQA